MHPAKGFFTKQNATQKTKHFHGGSPCTIPMQRVVAGSSYSDIVRACGPDGPDPVLHARESGSWGVWATTFRQGVQQGRSNPWVRPPRF